MKKVKCQNHGLDGLNDFTDFKSKNQNKSVASEKSVKISDSNIGILSQHHRLDGLNDFTDFKSCDFVKLKNLCNLRNLRKSVILTIIDLDKGIMKKQLIIKFRHSLWRNYDN